MTQSATSICLVLALTLVPPVTASLIPESGMLLRAKCKPGCKIFDDVADVCYTDRQCVVHSRDFAKYLECSKPCWDLNEPCWNLCWIHGQSFLDACKEDSACFNAKFTEKTSSLTLPSPDIGPFEA